MPAGTLYIVATPIGNLADASPRSLEVLRSAVVIACEDTRTSRTLLARYGIATPTVALHAHNEAAAGRKLLETLGGGGDVAVITDAGTPGVSDPSALLVAAAHRQGIRVVPIPGPSAVAAAYSAAGFGGDRFLFAGFLPPKPAARRKALEALDLPWPVVLYEAPHRVRATLADLAQRFGAEREVLIARELTKKFEEVARLPLGESAAWLDAAPHREQGEFVLVLAPGTPAPAAAAPDPEAVLALLLETLPPSEAARLAARITGAPKNTLYRKALGRNK